MRYDVIVSDSAWEMLSAHVRFLAEVDPKAAKKTQKKLSDALKSLQELPERFPFFDVDNIPRGKYHKMYVNKWYLIIYQIKDGTVYVDFILDGRQDYGWLFG